jgi:tRNA nucleotidyltransferase/poly(A) polymerase
MEFTEEYLGRLLLQKLKELESFEEVISIVKSNSQGNIYLVGGTVSRTLASAIYGDCQMDQDFDFVVDKVEKELDIPDGWNVTHHKFGNPTFRKGELEIDIFPLSDHPHIKKDNKAPTIDNFLEGVPFTIQALAFDIRNNRLIGKTGIEALRNKRFKVNNAEQAKDVAKRKGVNVNERMMQKAKSMNFDIEPFDG